jgi:hypothetical protein
MLILLAALIVAAAVAWAGGRVARATPPAPQASSDETRVVALLALFAPGMSASAGDPRALLVWQPIAAAARTMYPREFATLDAAFGRTFPFTPDQLQAAHARWTTDWLAWERTHDGECKLKAAIVAEELGDRAGSPYGRTRLDAVEREKLEQYQRRYEEYTRISKALQRLITATPPSPVTPG